MTDLGEISSYLGMHITRNRANRSLRIDQCAYIENLLIHFGMQDCNPTCTPLPPNIELTKSEDVATSTTRSLYQQLIGSLLYAMIVSRPDISFAVTKLAQYSHNPSTSHLAAAKHLIRYLKGTADLGICYRGSSGAGLIGYSDSDWAADRDDRRSMGAHVFLLAQGAVCWSSKKQHVVSLSSTEAEYMSLSQTAAQAAWIRSFLGELGMHLKGAITIVGDNKGSIDIANNPIVGRGTKHIAIRYHFIRDCVSCGQITLLRYPSSHITADTLTKSLPFPSFNTHRTGLGLSSE